MPSFVNLPWQIFAEGSRRKRETAIPDQKLERAGQILVRLFRGVAVNGDDAAKRKLIVIKKRKKCRRSSICLGKFSPRVHVESGKRQSPTKSMNEQDKTCSSFLWRHCQWGRRGKTRTYCYKITKKLPSFVNLPWQIFAEGSRRKRETAIPDKKHERAGQILAHLFCGAAFYNKIPLNYLFAANK